MTRPHTTRLYESKVRTLGRHRDRSVPDVARKLGLRVERRALGPCPACDAAQRGRADRRLPIGVTSNDRGWRCHSCGAGGDAITLVAYTQIGDARPSEGDGWPAIYHRLDDLFGSTHDQQAITPARDRLPKRPPLDQVQDVWATSLPATVDVEVRNYLQSRRIDARDVELLDAARALPPGRLPDWASIGFRSWFDAGYRLIVPLYDSNGQMRSLRARQITPAGDYPKEVAPRGGIGDDARLEVRGLCMADALARLCLSGGLLADGRSASRYAADVGVVIVEGTPDYLTACTCWIRDADERAPALLGIFSGAWTPEFAAKIPRGCEVGLLTHPDAGGDKLASGVAKTLDASCRVRRTKQ